MIFRWARALHELGITPPAKPDTDMAVLPSGRCFVLAGRRLVGTDLHRGTTERFVLRPGTAAWKDFRQLHPWLGEILALERSAKFSIREKEINLLVR